MQTLIKKVFLYVLIVGITLETAARLELTFGSAIFLKHAQTPTEASIFTTDDIGPKGVPYAKVKHVTLNKYGFNDSDDYVKETKTHALRILCLGDSIAFWGDELSDNWPGQLENLLQRRGIDAEVVNAAIPGNNYATLLGRLEKDYLDFKPDLVLVYKGFSGYMSPAINISLVKHRFLEWSVFFKNQIYRAEDIWRKLEWEGKVMPRKQLVDYATDEMLSSYVADLKKFAELSKKNGFQLVLASFPNLTSESNQKEYLDCIFKALNYYPGISVKGYLSGIRQFNEAGRKFTSSEKLIYVDLAVKVPHSKEYFFDDYHLTAEGARIVAEAYADSIGAWLGRKV